MLHLLNYQIVKRKIGAIVAVIFKCALKLFTRTFISSDQQNKTATITVNYTTEII